MKNKFIWMVLILFFLPISSFSQICFGSYELESQNEVNNFITNHNCTDIRGDMTISGNDITSLLPLNGVDISGGLEIINNPQLISLDGLSSIDGLRKLEIRGNNKLENLDGLNSLDGISEAIEIFNNAKLKNINGISSVQGESSTPWIVVGLNPDLENLNGLSGITHVKNRIWIAANTSLNDLDGLSTITTLSSPASSQQIDISGNNNLVSISGLGNIIDISGSWNIEIYGNSSLSDCNGICDLEENPNVSILVNANASGCNSNIEFAESCGELPVELITFTSISTNSHIHLYWQTVTETNNLGFEVQKSKDGIQWELLDFIEGQGNSVETDDYSYIDKNPFTGTNYYRLKQLDFDGAFEYSDVISTEFQPEDNDALQVFPNPIKDFLNIALPQKTTSSNVQIRIHNTSGQLIKSLNFFDQHYFQISVEGLSSGVYFLEVLDGREVMVDRIVKE